MSSRFNYILWLQDLLDTTSDDYRDKYDPDREVVGLDMWVGSFGSSPALSRQRHCFPFFQPLERTTVLTESSVSGTGALAIYPLLACRQRPNWKLIGTDIDDKNLSYAQRNVKTNGLGSRIRISKSDPNGPLIPAQLLENVERYASRPIWYLKLGSVS